MSGYVQPDFRRILVFTKLSDSCIHLTENHFIYKILMAHLRDSWSGKRNSESRVVFSHQAQVGLQVIVRVTVIQDLSGIGRRVWKRICGLVIRF